MNIFPSLKQRREVKRVRRRARAKSDAIDSQLEEEARRREQHHDVLLISPSFLFHDFGCCTS